ncbi:MAG: hypothetical protein PHO92_01820, partial [Candidatus Peribacteraceae bacterium]|nr:hypothetical protein [Candidatus Peribacteraceae bacterium]
MNSDHHQQLGRLRDASDALLGRQVVMENLYVPGTGEIPGITLNTQGRVAAVISSVGVYPNQTEGYEEKFGRERDPMTVFAFPMPHNNVGVSVVLEQGRNAIAVLAKLIAQVRNGNPKEMAWSTLLKDQDVGTVEDEGNRSLDPKQFDAFARVVDKAQIFSPASALRLERIEGFQGFESRVKPRNEDDHPDLDCIIELTPAAKKQLKRLLPFL